MGYNVNDIKVFLDSSAGWKARKVLDIRSEDEFRTGHLTGACSFALGPGQDAEGVPSILLPPRHVPLLVIGANDQDVKAVAHHLEKRGRCGVEAWEWRHDSARTLPREWVSTGPVSTSLWEPPSWLSKHLDLVPPPIAGEVLDLGCGSGRAMVWLAQKGYRTTGLGWQPEALDLGHQLAAFENVCCQFRRADLRDGASVSPGPWSVVLNFRFLQRDLFAALPRLLQPGGVCLVRTFREAPGYDGHPHPRHRLQSGELLRLFPRGSFEILAHEENFDEDGRPAAGIVARRLAP